MTATVHRAVRPAPGFDPSEREFMGLLTEAAELLGWRWAHFRPARTAHGWRTPVSGPLGAGWPDLVLTRDRDGRMLFAEIKSDHGKLSDEQSEVHEYLRRISRLHGWMQVVTWRPRDFEIAIEVLR
jgi:hypothetical protein